MNSVEFVKLLKEELEATLTSYKENDTHIGKKVQELACSEMAKAEVLSIISEAAKENLYVLLCALEGCSSLAGNQQIYKILDENENIVSGELDSQFYMQVLESE